MDLELPDSLCRPHSVITTNISCGRRTYLLTKTKSSTTSIKLLSTYGQPLYLTTILILLIINIIILCNISSLAHDPLTDLPSPLSLNHDTDQSKEVSLCEACRLVVDSFNKGVEETARGKHEGGDTSWEERNLKSYQDSEVRLIEIQERLCEDVKGAGKAQCLSLAEDTESEVEEWWFKQRNRNVRLFDFLCISKIKRCCPKGSYGPNCQPCQVNQCSKHGSCDGEGTRGGTGKCNCDTGYVGTNCNSCADDHFRVVTSEDFTCKKCDSACRGCYGPGQTNCTNCREGYYKNEVNGCIDINECDIGKGEGGKALCHGNKYCINTDGSYRCADCHESCSGCVAYGSDWCIACAPGFQMDDNDQCRTKEELERLKGWDYVDTARYGRNTLSRYFFYFGVLGVSVMMFRSNLYVMYTFTLGFIVVLLVSELNLLEDEVDFTTTQSSQE